MVSLVCVFVVGVNMLERPTAARITPSKINMPSSNISQQPYLFLEVAEIHLH